MKIFNRFMENRRVSKKIENLVNTLCEPVRIDTQSSRIKYFQDGTLPLLSYVGRELNGDMAYITQSIGDTVSFSNAVGKIQDIDRKSRTDSVIVLFVDVSVFHENYYDYLVEQRDIEIARKRELEGSSKSVERATLIRKIFLGKANQAITTKLYRMDGVSKAEFWINNEEVLVGGRLPKRH